MVDCIAGHAINPYTLSKWWICQFRFYLFVGYKELFLLADCLNVHFCHRVEVPAAITSELYGRIMDEMTWVVYSFYSYPSPQEFSRVGIGFLIKEMFEVLQTT